MGDIYPDSDVCCVCGDRSYVHANTLGFGLCYRHTPFSYVSVPYAVKDPVAYVNSRGEPAEVLVDVLRVTWARVPATDDVSLMRAAGRLADVTHG